MSGATNLIMGFCTRPKFSRLVPFIASLRRSGFAGEVVLIVEDVAAETVDQLRQAGIQVERAAGAAPPRMTAMAARYFCFLDWLVRHGERHASVLLADPTTTVFQSDPFATPLEAEIVYSPEYLSVEQAPALHEALVQAYGASVAANLRACVVANADITLASAQGMLRYLTAMTRELAGRTTPLNDGIDRAVHNFVVHMAPLRSAWLEQGPPRCVTMDVLPEEAVTSSGTAVLVGGRAPPILARWAGHGAVAQHVRTAPRFQWEAALQGAWPSRPAEPLPMRPVARDVVVAFYHRERDAEWQPLFLGSLRCVNSHAEVHCVGDFNDDEAQRLVGQGCTVHRGPATELAVADNVSHFYLTQVLDHLASRAAGPPDQVLVLDSMRAFFPRDPFATKTIGLSVFCEGPAPIGQSDYNHPRLGFFTPLDEYRLRQPVVSSSALRGSLPVLREFYRRLLAELVGRQELLTIHKVIQGLFNKLSHDRDSGFPVIAHPNGAEAYFDFWPSGLAVDRRHGMRIGGTVPAVVLGAHPETPTLMKFRIDIGLSES